MASGERLLNKQKTWELGGNIASRRGMQENCHVIRIICKVLIFSLRVWYCSRYASNVFSAALGAVVTLLFIYATKVPHIQEGEQQQRQRDATRDINRELREENGMDEPVTSWEIPSELYRPPGPPHPRASSPFLDALANCDSLECLKAAHLLPRGVAKFNHPHFIIMGFQKAATTSLYSYLARHNETLASSLKEPEFFVNGCKSYVPEKCSRNATIKYLHYTLRSWIYLDWNGTKGSFEGSTHIVRAGDILAPRLLHMLPWVKLIVSLREPISRAASMLIHNEDRNGLGCLSRHKTMGSCLLKSSQIKNPYDGGPSSYHEALYPWIHTWPSTQLLVLQYEQLVDEDEEKAELLRVKQYLGLDPSWPKENSLEIRNARRFKINPEGWPIPRAEYEELVSIARKDMEMTLDLLALKSLVADRKGWERRWEDQWQKTFDTCDSKDMCTMVLS